MASLSGVKIKNSYKSLLKVNDETNGVDSNLTAIEDGQAGSTPLQIATNKILIKPGTDSASAFAVQSQGGGNMLTIDTDSADKEVIVNDDAGAIDFRIETAAEDEAFVVDGGANHVYINKGENSVTASFHNTNDVAMSLTSAGIVFNEDAHATNDFRVESAAGTDAIFVDSGNNIVHINGSEAAVTTEIHNDNDVAISVNATEVVINEDSSSSVDFRAESNSGTHAIFVDASADKVAINQDEANLTIDLHNTNDKVLTIMGAGAVFNEDSHVDVDFRVESNSGTHAIFVDSGADTVYLNGNTAAVTTLISNNNDEVIRVNTTGVVFNEDSHADVDFRIESDGEANAFFLDSGNNLLEINAGESAFTTIINSTNDEAMRVDSTGVVFNEDGSTGNDFRVESDTKTHMFFVDASDNRIGIGTSSPDNWVDIEYDGTQLQLSYDESNAATFAVGSSGDLTVTPSGGDMSIVATTSIDLTSPQIDFGENDASDITLNFLGSTNDMAVLYDESTGTLGFDGAVLGINSVSNRVGIGTLVPDKLLHVYTSDAGAFGIHANADDVVVENGTDAGITLATADAGSCSYAFESPTSTTGQNAINWQYNSGSERIRMIVDSSEPFTVYGNKVGVNTTSPDTALEVVGSFAANGPSSTFITMGSGDTSPDVSGGNIFKTHSTGVTIDQFDGGVCGQIITIISGGATVYDVTSSELKGGTTNITTAAGDVTMWVCESATVWHLLSWMDLSIDLSSGGF